MRALILALALAFAADTPATYRTEIEQYRKHRIEELTAPNGWLAVQGLFWLHEGANTAGSDPASPRSRCRRGRRRRSACSR